MHAIIIQYLNMYLIFIYIKPRLYICISIDYIHIEECRVPIYGYKNPIGEPLKTQLRHRYIHPITITKGSVKEGLIGAFITLCIN